MRKRLEGAEHVSFFHFLTEGECKVRLLESKEVLEARAGDLVLFPQEGKHLMGTDLQLAPMEAGAVVTIPADFDSRLGQNQPVQVPVAIDNLNTDFTNDIRRAVPPRGKRRAARAEARAL